MGVARRFAPHGPEPEAFGGIVTCRANPPVVEDQGFGALSFEEQLAVIGACDRVAQKPCGAVGVEHRLERPEFGAVGRLVGHGGAFRTGSNAGWRLFAAREALVASLLM